MAYDKEQLKEWETQELIRSSICLDRSIKETKRDLEVLKGEINRRAEIQMNTRNQRYVKYYGGDGSVSVMDGQTLEVLNVDRLRELVSGGVWSQMVTETSQTKYKFKPTLENALKAVFTGDYVRDMTLEEVVDDILSYHDDPEGAMRKTLLKKLKGDYLKDRQLIINTVFGGEDADLDTELWLIYKIKNWQLITMFFEEEEIDGIMETVRKCVRVESKTALTLDYE